jgi:DNA repair exonuclease SbcCD ATPase subunit
MTKTCTACKEDKPVEAFSRSSRNKSGRQSRCKDCFNKWYEANKNGVLARARYARDLAAKNSDEGRMKQRAARFKRLYGMTLEEYAVMVEAQEFKCAVCGRHHDDERNGLVVDHDHITGKIRALLCDRCNVGIGNLGDDPDRLIRAAEYLRIHATPC